MNRQFAAPSLAIRSIFAAAAVVITVSIGGFIDSSRERLRDCAAHERPTHLQRKPSHLRPPLIDRAQVLLLRFRHARKRSTTRGTGLTDTVPHAVYQPEVPMKDASRFSALPSPFLALSRSAISPSAQAEFKCDQPQLTRVDATACAKAAESSTALRRYIWRTRMIYGLQMNDYLRPVRDEPKARSAPASR